jgi:hypothetical protein
MRVEHLRRLLPNLSTEDIERGGRVLEQRRLITIGQHVNTMIPGRVLRTFTLTDPSKYPVQETVRIGDVEFPRSFQGDMAGAEDLNAYIEAIADYHATVEQRVTRLAEHLTRRYWGNMAALLGLFVGVFALITQGTQLISARADLPASTLFFRNLAAVGPLALVLSSFVVLLWSLSRRL